MAKHRTRRAGRRERRKRGSVTWFAARKCYKVRVGGRTFYFGEDMQAAEAEAAVIRAQWKRHKAAGAKRWPEGQPDRVAIRDALGLSPDVVLARVVGVAPAELPPAVTVQAASVTLGQAASLYVEELSRTADVAPRTLSDTRQRLGRVLDAMGRETPLRDVGQVRLAEFVGQLRAGKLPDRDGELRDVSRLYGRHLAQALRVFLRWVSDHDALEWEMPKRGERLLRLGREKPRTDEERERFKARAWGEEEERYFTIDELRKLYAAADVRLRAFIMLGLNCAFYGSEAGSLKVTDLKVNGETWVQSVRPKTNQKVRHPLWPETVAAIEAARAPENTGGWLFLTGGGKPYVGHAVKNLAHKWADLRVAAGVPDAPAMKYLRHTSAAAIRRIAGAEVAETHLGHADAFRLGPVYTSKLWDQHAEAVRRLREEFRAVWEG